MTNISDLLFLIFAGMVMRVSSCPARCTCSDELVDYQMGRVVDCSNLGLGTMPSITAGALKLDFSHNRLDRVPNMIRHLPELRELDISNNRIHYDVQNDIFQANNKLLILDLHSNYISTFYPSAFTSLNRLKKLDLHDNIIVSFPADLFKPIPLETVVCLGSNHWDCSCDLFVTMQIRLHSGSSTCGGESPECTSPPDWYGRRISDVSQQELDTSCQPDPILTTMIENASSDITTNVPLTTKYITEVGEKKVSGNSFTSSIEVRESPILDYVRQENTLMEFVTNNPMVSAGVLLICAIFLGIFLVLAIVLRRTSSKQGRNDGKLVSPWPLLQARPLPALLPMDNPSVVIDYEEIPLTQNRMESGQGNYVIEKQPENCSMNEERIVLTDKNPYSTTVENVEETTLGNQLTHTIQGAEGDVPGNSQGSYAFSVFRGRVDHSQYMPMRSSVLLKDLYAPLEEQL